MAEKSNTNLYLVAIVAVVALVALIVLYLFAQSVPIQETSFIEENESGAATGEAYRTAREYQRVTRPSGPIKSSAYSHISALPAPQNTTLCLDLDRDDYQNQSSFLG